MLNCAAVMVIFDPSTLHRRHALPGDLQDVQDNFGKWVALGKRINALGIVLLILLIKFPSARGAFVTELNKRKNHQDTAFAVYQALKATALLLSCSNAYRREIDDIKAMGLAHGLAIIGTRLGVWKAAADGKVQLHTSLYTILPYSNDCRDQIKLFLNADLNSFIADMDTATSVQNWQTTFKLFRQKCKQAKVPLMSSNYNPEWTFRGFQIGAMHGNVRRLYYSDTDLIVELPGPDMNGNRHKLAIALGGVKAATVARLYKHKRYSPKCAPELVSMILCLDHGRSM